MRPFLCKEELPRFVFFAQESSASFGSCCVEFLNFLKNTELLYFFDFAIMKSWKSAKEPTKRMGDLLKCTNSGSRKEFASAPTPKIGGSQ